MNEKISKLRKLAIERFMQNNRNSFTKEYRARLTHELEIIEKTRTEDCFLSFIQQGDKAKVRGDYYVKGVANCSLLLYCTNTTTVDPLVWDLPFERFLNPLRGGEPYFEIEFATKRTFTQEEQNTDLETLFVNRAIESGQISQNALDAKNAYKGIQEYQLVKEVLTKTNNVLIWQEQLVEMLHLVGGFSYAEADVVRQNIGKKRIPNISENLRQFVEHAKHAGYDYEWANGLFVYMMARYPYLPCKAHHIASCFYFVEK